jgi:hypothetical protein
MLYGRDWVLTFYRRRSLATASDTPVALRPALGHPATMGIGIVNVGEIHVPLYCSAALSIRGGELAERRTLEREVGDGRHDLFDRIGGLQPSLERVEEVGGLPQPVKFALPALDVISWRWAGAGCAVMRALARGASRAGAAADATIHVAPTACAVSLPDVSPSARSKRNLEGWARDASAARNSLPSGHRRRNPV